MALHPDVEARLARLTADQRLAATAPPGPVLCIAPAGSGKTTTLVARIAWLVAIGSPADRIAAIAFNRRAAEELADRLGVALAPLGVRPGAVRVRTFHALGREILRDSGRPVGVPVDRDAVLRRILPNAAEVELRATDAAISRLKLDLRVSGDEVAADSDAGPLARAYVDYERTLTASGELDFDDLVAGALAALEDDPRLLARWRASCTDLLVDEVQDVDRSQLDLALLLASPADRIFLVGDDDQSIYGWRLADVRRVLDLGDRLPGLRRYDLVTNFRCPAPVVERSVRLIEANRERFAKRIVPRDRAAGRLILAPDASDDDDRARHVLSSWPPPGDSDGAASRAILARTNRELLPAAAVALESGIPFRAERLELLLEDPRLDELLAALGTDEAERTDSRTPTLVRIARLRAATGPDALGGLDGLLAALLGWAAPYRELRTFVEAVRARRHALAELRRDDADLVLATAHGTKGLEFDHVAVVDMDADRFPSRRSLDDAPDPARGLEDERRLAYVAWTRARRSLTLVYDPAAPSPFLREAFEPEELGLLP